MSHNSSQWRRYGVAVVTVGAMGLLRSAIAWEPGHFTYIVFLIPVLCSAWYGGLGPSMVAMILGVLIANYFFQEGPHEFHFSKFLDQERISVFVVNCIVGSFIIERLHAARQRAEDNEYKLLQQISERMEVEKKLLLEVQERVRAENKLKETLARAETANTAKSSFLANMSHEIRTPMNAVVGISSILAMSHALTPEKQQELIRTLQLSAQSMMALIDDLLDITKIENDSLPLEKEPFNLRHLLDDVIDIMSVRAKEKNISLTLQCDETHAMFMGASLRIRQVLLNLIGNAVKFTEKGGVTLRIYSDRNPMTREEETVFEISDTGIGIPEEKFEAIFHKFSQADSSIRRKFGGTGLGLAITRRLVELMEGNISLSSVLGQGSVFRMALPLVKVAEQKIASREPQQQEMAIIPHERAKPTVLLVEDYQPNILIASFVLEELECNYEIAGNGSEALAKVESRPFNLILMDIQMPGMDGYEAVQRIRAYEKGHGLAPTPIIGVSAHAFHEDKTRSLSVGMDDYISKPFNVMHLKERIMTLMRRESQEAA